MPGRRGRRDDFPNTLSEGVSTVGGVTRNRHSPAVEIPLRAAEGAAPLIRAGGCRGRPGTLPPPRSYSAGAVEAWDSVQSSFELNEPHRAPPTSRIMSSVSPANGRRTLVFMGAPFCGRGAQPLQEGVLSLSESAPGRRGRAGRG